MNTENDIDIRFEDIDIYEGLGNDFDKTSIQKSRPLMILARKLPLPELKITDVYLSRIDIHNPQKRTVIMAKGELENYLGLKRILRDDLKNRLSKLFTAIEIPNRDKPRGIDLISLFVRAQATQDDEGLWTITLTCSEEAMKYIFNIENFGYVKYRLRNIKDLTSIYSYRMYTFLLGNEFRFKKTAPAKAKSISIEELRAELGCTAELYNSYAKFNEKILKKCQKELAAKTNLSFTYEIDRSKKQGRHAKDLIIEVEVNKEDMEMTNESALPEQPIPVEDTKIIEERQRLADEGADSLLEEYGTEEAVELASVFDYAFDNKQIQEISKLLDTLKEFEDEEYKTNGCPLTHTEKLMYLEDVAFDKTTETSDYTEWYSRIISKLSSRSMSDNAAEKYGDIYRAEIARITDFAFNKEQIDEIYSIISETDTSKYSGNFHERAERYFTAIYTRFKRVEKEKEEANNPIKDRYRYLRTLLQKEADVRRKSNV